MSDYFEDRTPSSKKRVDVVLDRTKSVLQIVAVLVAAGWAVWRFDLFESPEYEHRARLEGNVEWQERTEKECIGWYNIKFENIGKCSIELAQLKLYVWQFDPGSQLDRDKATTPFSYVDALNLIKGKTEIVEQSLLEKVDLGKKVGEFRHFNTEFSPGVSDKAGFMVLAKRDGGKFALFMVTGKSRIRGQTDELDWHDHQIEYVCDESGYKDGTKHKGVFGPQKKSLDGL